MPETLTDIFTLRIPALCHAAICRHDSSIIQSPSSNIKFDSSAIGINSEGGIIPSTGWSQRVSASK